MAVSAGYIVRPPELGIEGQCRLSTRRGGCEEGVACMCVCVCVCVCVSTCIYTDIYISNCTETVYKLPLLPNNTAVKHFYTNWSVAKC